MSLCIDLGYELVTSDVVLNNPYAVQRDVTIPTGKVVTGAGGRLISVDGTAFDDSHAYWTSGTAQIEIQSGPHPSDATKWRFFVSSAAGGSGGLGIASTVRVWIATVND